LRNFNPFHWGGLWLAVTITPAWQSASWLRVNCTVGVKVNPKSTTRQPTLAKPARTTSATITAELRPSRPNTTVGRG